MQQLLLEHSSVDHRDVLCERRKLVPLGRKKESWGSKGNQKYPVTSLRFPKPKSMKSSDSSANLSESVKSLLKETQTSAEEMSGRDFNENV
ncbi:hypothetical protein NPIL_166171 [Nephila pilipes]|uniref:Uncharacterized protein n=1 Tax=Nephila pilipes TaxID=299642 RepID=A0A8X6T6I0_NEPPI|nr:hypothetical protein NPIL_166171 [Nephila pilipes]